MLLFLITFDNHFLFDLIIKAVKRKFLPFLLIAVLFANSSFCQYASLKVFRSLVLEHNYLGTPIHLSCIFYNPGTPDTIRHFIYNYSINNGITHRVHMDTIFKLSNNIQLDYPSLINITTEGSYIIRVWVDSVDGRLNANYLDTFVINTKFYNKSPLLHKKVMLEEFTGSWCGYCSGGALNFTSLLKTDSDFVGAAIHISETYVPDSMQIPEGVTSFSTRWGVPLVGSDRYRFSDLNNLYTINDAHDDQLWVSYLSGIFGGRKMAATPANVSLTNLQYDSVTRVLSVDVNATFLANLYDGDYRFNLIITEDSVKGTGPGWDQNNYDYSHLGGVHYDTLSPLFLLPLSLPANGQPGGWVHNHVLRKIPDGTWGIPNLIPSTPTSGTTYTRHYSLTIPKRWNVNQVHLIGAIQEYYPQSSVNFVQEITFLNVADKLLINRHTTTQVSEPYSDNMRMSFYPNPTTGNLKIDVNKNTEKASVSIYDLTGKKVLESELHTGTNLFYLALPNGMYQVQLSTNGYEQHEKLLIIN